MTLKKQYNELTQHPHIVSSENYYSLEQHGGKNEQTTSSKIYTFSNELSQHCLQHFSGQSNADAMTQVGSGFQTPRNINKLFERAILSIQYLVKSITTITSRITELKQYIAASARKQEQEEARRQEQEEDKTILVHYDTDKNGVITRDEYVNNVVSFYFPNKDNVTNNDLENGLELIGVFEMDYTDYRNMWKNSDINKNAVIDKDEFNGFKKELLKTKTSNIYGNNTLDQYNLKGTQNLKWTGIDINNSEQYLRFFKRLKHFIIVENIATYISFTDNNKEVNFERDAIKYISTVDNPLAFQNISVKDYTAPGVEALIKLWEILDKADTKHRVIMHCTAGWGRTGTMIMSFIWLNIYRKFIKHKSFEYTCTGTTYGPKVIKILEESDILIESDPSTDIKAQVLYLREKKICHILYDMLQAHYTVHSSTEIFDDPVHKPTSLLETTFIERLTRIPKAITQYISDTKSGGDTSMYNNYLMMKTKYLALKELMRADK